MSVRVGANKAERNRVSLGSPRESSGCVTGAAISSKQMSPAVSLSPKCKDEKKNASAREYESQASIRKSKADQFFKQKEKLAFLKRLHLDEQFIKIRPEHMKLLEI